MTAKKEKIMSAQDLLGGNALLRVQLLSGQVWSIISSFSLLGDPLSPIPSGSRPSSSGLCRRKRAFRGSKMVRTSTSSATKAGLHPHRDMECWNSGTKKFTSPTPDMTRPLVIRLSLSNQWAKMAVLGKIPMQVAPAPTSMP